MTQVMPNTTSDSEISEGLNRMLDEGGTPRKRSVIRTMLPLLICILIGAEVGLGLGLLSAPDPQATARIQVVPDPSVSGNLPDTSQANRFVQGEVLKISGDDLQEQAENAVGGTPALSITATQVESTDVVEVTVVASTDNEAVQLTQALIQAYADGREQAFDQGIDASLAVVNGQLTSLAKSSAPRSDTGLEYTRLLAQRNGLQLARDSRQTAVPVILRPRVVEQSRWPTAVRDAFVGLVLGGLLGLVLKLLVDRSSRRPGEAPRSWS